MAISTTLCVRRRSQAGYDEDMAELELNTFGERVAWLLKRRRIAEQPIASQKELAAEIGMKPQQLTKIVGTSLRILSRPAVMAGFLLLHSIKLLFVFSKLPLDIYKTMGL